MFFLLALSLKPAISSGEPSYIREMFHNLLHVPAYATLTFFCFCFLGRGKNKVKESFGVFTFSFLYGAFMEILQGFVPGRNPSLYDLALNAAGILLVIFLLKKRIITIHEKNSY